MSRNPKKKKALDITEAEDSSGDDDARQEIADKTQQRKVAKAKSKSSFIRRKNQLLDLLEDAIAANHREIGDFRKLLDERQQRVVEDLSSWQNRIRKQTMVVLLRKQVVKLMIAKKNLLKLNYAFKSICMPSKMNCRVKHQNFLGNYWVFIHRKRKRASP